ncbi:MAG: hypothetical protein V5A55_08095 [Halovenus sp.]
MSDAIPSDHDAVESHRVTLSQVGSTHRLQVPLPAAASCEPGDVVSLSLSGDRVYAAVTTTLRGDRAVRDAFPTRHLARRDGEGEDELARWLDRVEADTSDTLVLDVLTEGYAYGLREPGTRVVYAPPDPPDQSLADIARSLGTE